MKLFTTGPVGVSPSVLASLQRDLGTFETEFMVAVNSVQAMLLKLAGFNSTTHACVLMQGSGTYTIESALRTVSTEQKKFLILSSGFYGLRLAEICRKAKILHDLIEFPEDQAVELDERAEALLLSGTYGALVLVHCETASGVLNPMEAIGRRLKSNYPQLTYIVDAMSTLGGVESNYTDVDFLLGCANKCIQGIPGVGFAICRKKVLSLCEDRSSSLCLDLYSRWRMLEEENRFIFTPPTHVVLGLKTALEELEKEGLSERVRRYKENNRILREGMTTFGFRRFVDDSITGHINTSFHYHDHASFDFDEFYSRLLGKGQLIFSMKSTKAECFRVGNIGHIFPEDCKKFLQCTGEVLHDMRNPIKST